jgi:transposase
VLYHHGCPQRRGLMQGDGRDWLGALALPDTARQQITVSLQVIDALELQITPLDRQLRCYARRQTGCKALIAAHYGIGELCAITILSELGDVGRFDNSRDAVRYGGMGITVYQSDRHRSPGISPARARRRCAGRCTRPRRPPAAPARPTATTTCRRPSDSAATVPAWRSHASCSNAATTRSANSATTP